VDDEPATAGRNDRGKDLLDLYDGGNFQDWA
jgi:hypothetical protein